MRVRVEWKPTDLGGMFQLNPSLVFDDDPLEVSSRARWTDALRRRGTRILEQLFARRSF